MYALAREEFERVLTRSDLNELERLVAAVDPQPRRRWRCLSYCILDAVWSMGAPHDTVVVPLVHRVAREHGDDNPLLPAGESPPPDSMSLWPFLSRFSERNALTGYTNAQRTSPYGALKADVAQKHARVLLDHGIQTVHDIEPLMDNRRWFPHVNATLAQLPGDGRHGTRRSYLWMLAGENDRVRPDHLVLRWFTRYGLDLSPISAHFLMYILAARRTETGQPSTVWEVNHAIWTAERSSKAPADASTAASAQTPTPSQLQHRLDQPGTTPSKPS